MRPPLLALLLWIAGARAVFYPGSCRSSPCGIGGACTAVGGSYFCSCEAGYFGGRCEIQQCDPNVCENGGKCVKGGRLPLPGNFHCECPNGFTGPTCSEVAPSICSETRPCGPHGKCRMIGEHEKDDTGRDFECDCEEGWSGPDCRIEQPSCGDYRHCRNGGRCVNIAGNYSCDCAEGFTGPNCGTQIDICQRDAPCMNNGTCTNTDPGSFHCSCARGFGGRRCEISLAFSPSSCSPRLESAYACLNGGKCTANGCVCPSGWRGRHCERDVHECDFNPCRNGGECIEQDGGSLCICPPYYEGSHCEKRIMGGCTGHQCSAGSQCIEDGLDSYSCSCPAGKTGRFCNETATCGGAPCIHGNCLVDGDTQTCECEQGWNGTSCNVDIDECAYAPCAAGAQCLNSEGGFSCRCPPGTTGALCQTAIIDCSNGGCGQDSEICREVECPAGSVCIADRTKLKGYFCDFEREQEKKGDWCASMACENGASCQNTTSGPKCHCTTPFYGERCEYFKDPCDDSSCANGALCKPLPDLSGFSCECPAGFSGKHCTHNDDDCEEGLCLNGARCIDGINDFRCECGREFSGKYCEERVDTGVYNGTDEVDKASCLRSNCASKASNGVCDRECNHFACGWDGGDCSARQKTPFENCPDASYCAHAFGNGVCDELCNNEKCLFDGFDCVQSAKKCPASRRTFCLDHYADGVCDEACNDAECGFDGGDCETAEEKKKNETMDISIIVGTEPRTFAERSDEFLFRLGELLRATVRIKESQEGPDVFEWSQDRGKGNRIAFRSEAPLSSEATGLHGIIVDLEVDVAECRGECFKDTQAVVAFLGAAVAKEVLVELGMEFIEAAPLKVPPPPKLPPLIIIGIIVLIAIIFGAGVVIVRPVRQVAAKTWTPPFGHAYDTQYYNGKFYASKNDIRAEAVEMKQRPLTPEPALSQLALMCLKTKIPDDMDLSQAAVNEASYCGRTPLHFLMEAHNKATANKLADLQRLYDAGADLDARDKEGKTALHYACRSISVSAVCKLLDLGANPCLQTEEGETPLHVSAKLGDDRIIDILCKEEGVKEQIEIVDDSDNTALMMYCAWSPFNTKGAEILMDALADVNCAGDKDRRTHYRGRTALHAAAEYNTTNKFIIPMLIRRGANVDAEDREGRRPLWVATKFANEVAIDALLRAGANPFYDIGPDATIQTNPYQLARERADLANILAIFESIKPQGRYSVGSVQRSHKNTKKAKLSPAGSSSGYSSTATPSPPLVQAPPIHPPPPTHSPPWTASAASSSSLSVSPGYDAGGYAVPGNAAYPVPYPGQNPQPHFPSPPHTQQHNFYNSTIGGNSNFSHRQNQYYPAYTQNGYDTQNAQNAQYAQNGYNTQNGYDSNHEFQRQ